MTTEKKNTEKQNKYKKRIRSVGGKSLPVVSDYVLQ